MHGITPLLYRGFLPPQSLGRNLTLKGRGERVIPRTGSVVRTVSARKIKNIFDEFQEKK